MARLIGSLVIVAVLAVIALLVYIKVTGLNARTEPGPVETSVARAIRRLAVPADVRDRRNPVELTEEVAAEGLAHFADHCASCHGNDGGGDTEMGRGLYPKVPDMRHPATQQLTDGELFYIIENGVRFTGMPGWATGTPAGEQASWHLVHFIRRLPNLTAEETKRIEALSPRSPEAIRQEIAEEQFLQGDDNVPPTSGSSTTHQHRGEANEYEGNRRCGRGTRPTRACGGACA
jgi:mono/diheme cytochrome c family protein